jgi:hypothetical protein
MGDGVDEVGWVGEDDAVGEGELMGEGVGEAVEEKVGVGICEIIGKEVRGEVAEGVGEGIGIEDNVELNALSPMLGINTVRYINQPVGKVIVLTICPAGVTSTITAPLSVKFQGWFSINWCVGVPKSPNQSPFGNISAAPKNCE